MLPNYDRAARDFDPRFGRPAEAAHDRGHARAMDRILNDLFYGRSHIAGSGELSIAFLLDENPTVEPVGSGGERSGGARKVLNFPAIDFKRASFSCPRNTQSPRHRISLSIDSNRKS